MSDTPWHGMIDQEMQAARKRLDHFAKRNDTASIEIEDLWRAEYNEIYVTYEWYKNYRRRNKVKDGR
jgi:hypothetical protein